MKSPTKNINIAYIGGGSRGWAWTFMTDLAMDPSLSGTIRLYDINEQAARNNEIIGNRLKARDDIVLLGSSGSGIKQAVKKLSEWLDAQFGMKSRTTTGIMKLMTMEEEKNRKHRQKAGRGVTAIDAGGYRISRTHITIRKRNAPRIIRCMTRAWDEYRRTGTIKRQRACQIISRNGMIRNANCRRFTEKYHVVELMRIARRVQAYWSRENARRRKERVKYAVERHEKQCAALCCDHG